VSASESGGAHALDHDHRRARGVSGKHDKPNAGKRSRDRPVDELHQPLPDHRAENLPRVSAHDLLNKPVEPTPEPKPERFIEHEPGATASKRSSDDPGSRWITLERSEPKGGGGNVLHLPTPDTALPFEFEAIDRWDLDEVPQREWLVEHMIPGRNVTLLSGPGAIGKSILIMQLCAATALGKDWIQQLPTPGPAVYVGAEDDVDELHRRLAAIVAHYHGTFAEMRNRLFISSLAGKDAVLGAADRTGKVNPTPLFTRLFEVVTAIKPKLIALDTAADLFAGNENDRTQARQFIGLLRMLAIAGNSSVLLASHPSLQGISTDSGSSGSTGWSNSVRSRLYMKPATAGDADTDDKGDDGLRILEMKKTNYGRPIEAIRLRWQNGVYVPIGTPSTLDKLAADQKAEQAFLALLDRFTAQNQRVTHEQASWSNYAPKRFAEHPDGKAIGERALAMAMQRLLDARTICIETMPGKPSRRQYKLVRA
jgi:RecA-family ATPase